MEKSSSHPDPYSWMQHHSLVSSRKSGKEKCEKDWNWKPPPLPDYDLWHVVSGSGNIQINSIDYPVTAGTCFLLRPGDRIFAEQDPEQRLTVIFIHYRAEIAFPPASADSPEASMLADSPNRKTAGKSHPLPRYVHIQDIPWMELVLGRLLALDDEEQGIVNAAEFDALLRAALCVVIRDSLRTEQQQSHRHIAVQQAIRLIKENPADPPGHEVLAAHAGLSPRYLNVLFKKQTGVSVKTFLARARVERACQLLAESTMNVSQIAETMGYSDIYFFSKQFKQFVGESPLRYRNRTTNH